MANNKSKQSTKRYFQLNSNILLEYEYTPLNIYENQRGDVSDVLVDLRGNDIFTIVDNKIDNGTYFYMNNDATANQGNFVIPVNKSKTKYLKYNNYNDYYGTFKKYENANFEVNHGNGEINDDNDFDVPFDKIRLHFTSKNFIDEYDSLILQAYIRSNSNRKIYLLSFNITRFDSVILNAEPMLINEKIYTSYIDAKIVSTNALLNYNQYDDAHSGIRRLLEYILPSANNDKIIKNSNITFELYGVKNTTPVGNYDSYVSELINTNVVPSNDSFDKIYVEITESDEGDYFEMSANSENHHNFSDFINSITDTPESYMILHDITLTEYYVNKFNKLVSEITHREHLLINAAYNDDSAEMVINKNELDKKFTYRPICKHGSDCIRFLITDVMKIVDTNLNTAIVKTGSLLYDKPYKYGKRLNQIYLGQIPSVINVYNKRSNLMDEDIEHVNLPSTGYNFGSSNFSIETNNVQITSFCETVNIRLNIENMMKYDVSNLENSSADDVFAETETEKD